MIVSYPMLSAWHVSVTHKKHPLVPGVLLYPLVLGVLLYPLVLSVLLYSLVLGVLFSFLFVFAACKTRSKREAKIG